MMHRKDNDMGSSEEDSGGESGGDEGAKTMEELESMFHIDNHRTHSEYMTMKQMNEFNQEVLRPTAIFTLDFDSDIFLWIGSKVPKDKIVTCFKHVDQACRSVHSKGKRRRDRINFSITYEGFEPEIFKQAFPSWTPFKRPGLDDNENISEEDEDSDSNSDKSSDGKSAGEEKKEDVKEESKELSESQKKVLAGYLPEDFWINV